MSHPSSQRTLPFSIKETSLLEILKDDLRGLNLFKDLPAAGKSNYVKGGETNKGWFYECSFGDVGSIRIPRGADESVAELLSTVQGAEYEIGPLNPNEHFRRMFEADDMDERANYMARLQDQLRAGRNDVIGVIVKKAVDQTSSIESRRLALQVLVGAKSKALLQLAKVLIINFLDSHCEDLQYTAIACASHLPKDIARDIRPQLMPLLTNSRFQAPINALLERIS